MYWVVAFFALWTCAVAIALFVLWRRMRKAILLPGRIVSITAHQTGDDMFSPVVEFTNVRGQVQVFQSSASASVTTFWGRVGDSVTVAIDPDQPDKPDLHTPRFALAIGAVLLATGIAMTGFAASKIWSNP